jgi:hypothetical protein
MFVKSQNWNYPIHLKIEESQKGVIKSKLEFLEYMDSISTNKGWLIIFLKIERGRLPQKNIMEEREDSVRHKKNPCGC